jgi:hypothetical protein
MAIAMRNGVTVILNLSKSVDRSNPVATAKGAIL